MSVLTAFHLFKPVEAALLKIVRYSLMGGAAQPPNREILKIDEDGSFWMWRSVGTAASPPTPIGRFIGRLQPVAQEELRSNVDALEHAGNLRMPSAPHDSTERIDAGEAYATLGAGGQPREPWRSLVHQMRELLGSLTRTPAAAVGLELAGSGNLARLVHLGSQSLRLDFNEFVLRAVLSGSRSENNEITLLKESAISGQVTVDKGWNLDLPFGLHDPSVLRSRPAFIATFAAYDGESRTPVLVKAG